MTDPLVLPVRLKRVQRALLLRGAINEGVPAVTMLAAGVQGMRGSAGDRALAVVELLASGVLLTLLVREARHRLGESHDHALAPVAPGELAEELHGVDRIGVASAGLIAVELLHRWHETGHVKAWNPYTLAFTVTLFLALGGRRLIARAKFWRDDRRPRIALSTEGLEYRGSRRRRFAAGWDEVAAIETGAERVHVRLHDGRRFDLHAHEHVQGAALVAAVTEALPRFAPGRLRPTLPEGTRVRG